MVFALVRILINFIAGAGLSGYYRAKPYAEYLSGVFTGYITNSETGINH